VAEKLDVKKQTKPTVTVLFDARESQSKGRNGRARQRDSVTWWTRGEGTPKRDTDKPPLPSPQDSYSG
jgi:hypothetical protein